MTPAEALRAAADAVENRVVSEREAGLILLMALHIAKVCEARPVEVKLLCQLLERD